MVGPSFVSMLLRICTHSSMLRWKDTNVWRWHIRTLAWSLFSTSRAVWFKLACFQAGKMAAWSQTFCITATLKLKKKIFWMFWMKNRQGSCRILIHIWTVRLMIWVLWARCDKMDGLNLRLSRVYLAILLIRQRSIDLPHMSHHAPLQPDCCPSLKIKLRYVIKSSCFILNRCCRWFKWKDQISCSSWTFSLLQQHFAA